MLFSKSEIAYKKWGSDITKNPLGKKVVLFGMAFNGTENMGFQFLVNTLEVLPKEKYFLLANTITKIWTSNIKGILSQ